VGQRDEAMNPSWVCALIAKPGLPLNIGEGIKMLTAVVTTCISVAALIVSVINWRERRRDLLLQMHERLIASELQRGRHILAQLRSPEDVERLLCGKHTDYELVCRALSMLDLAALYIQHGYIDRSLFLEEWASTYSNLKESTILLVNARRRRDLDYNDWQWPHFQALANALRGNDVTA